MLSLTGIIGNVGESVSSGVQQHQSHLNAQSPNGQPHYSISKQSTPRVSPGNSIIEESNTTTKPSRKKQSAKVHHSKKESLAEMIEKHKLTRDEQKKMMVVGMNKRSTGGHTANKDTNSKTQSEKKKAGPSGHYVHRKVPKSEEDKKPRGLAQQLSVGQYAPDGAPTGVYSPLTSFQIQLNSPQTESSQKKKCQPSPRKENDQKNIELFSKYCQRGLKSDEDILELIKLTEKFRQTNQSDSNITSLLQAIDIQNNPMKKTLFHLNCEKQDPGVTVESKRVNKYKAQVEQRKQSKQMTEQALKKLQERNKPVKPGMEADVVDEQAQMSSILKNQQASKRNFTVEQHMSMDNSQAAIPNALKDNSKVQSKSNQVSPSSVDPLKEKRNQILNALSQIDKQKPVQQNEPITNVLQQMRGKKIVIMNNLPPKELRQNLQSPQQKPHQHQEKQDKIHKSTNYVKSEDLKVLQIDTSIKPVGYTNGITGNIRRGKPASKRGSESGITSPPQLPPNTSHHYIPQIKQSSQMPAYKTQSHFNTDGLYIKSINENDSKTGAAAQIQYDNQNGVKAVPQGFVLTPNGQWQKTYYSNQIQTGGNMTMPKQNNKPFSLRKPNEEMAQQNYQNQQPNSQNKAATNVSAVISNENQGSTTLCRQSSKGSSSQSLTKLRQTYSAFSGQKRNSEQHLQSNQLLQHAPNEAKRKPSVEQIERLNMQQLQRSTLDQDKDVIINMLPQVNRNIASSKRYREQLHQQQVQQQAMQQAMIQQLKKENQQIQEKLKENETKLIPQPKDSITQNTRDTTTSKTNEADSTTISISVPSNQTPQRDHFEFLCNELHKEIQQFSKSIQKQPTIKKPIQSKRSSTNPTALTNQTYNEKKCQVQLYHPYSNKSIQSSRINLLFNSVNHYIAITFKNKETQNLIPQNTLKHVKRLSSLFGIKIPKQSYLIDNAYFKSKDFIQIAKEALLRAILNLLNQQNRVPLQINPQSNLIFMNGEKQVQLGNISYKAFVCRGNHGYLVKNVLRNRSWWNVTDKPTSQTGEEMNFIWTQWFRRKYSRQLKRKIITEDDSDESVVEHIDQQETAAETQDKSQIQSKKPLQTFIQSQSVYNRLHKNYHLTNKKALFWNMTSYYQSVGKNPIDAIPLTFHINNSIQDSEFARFKKYFSDQQQKIHDLKSHYDRQGINYNSDSDSDEESSDEEEGYTSKKAAPQIRGGAYHKKHMPKPPSKKPHIPRNVWIIKPGENSNRGCGINVSNNISEINSLVKSFGNKHTCIIQKYLERPLLVYRRKFDLRVFGMLTSINGVHKGYYFEEGYLRTTGTRYNLDNLHSRFVHLTNDAVQKKSENYGKYENGNKMSYDEFQKYIDEFYPDSGVVLERDILPQIKQIIADSYKAVYGKIDPQRRSNSFEIYGYDFMLDENFKVYLIEVNTNPCLETPCPLLSRIITQLLDNAFRFVIDPLFLPPDYSKAMRNQFSDSLMQETRYELIFDEVLEQSSLQKLLQDKRIQEATKKLEAEVGYDEDQDADKEEEDDEEDEEETAAAGEAN